MKHGLYFGLLFCGNLSLTAADLKPEVFDRQLRLALRPGNPLVQLPSLVKPPVEAEKVCSIPLLEVKADHKIDPGINKNKGLAKPSKFSAPNPAPTCKDWNKKP